MHNETPEPLNSYTFSKRAETKIQNEFPELNPGTNTLVLFLNRTADVVTSVLESEVHRPMGLSWAGYRMLFALWVTDELEPARIAELTYTSRASVTSLMNSFIDRGHLTRRPSQTDGRSVVLSLTESGLNLARSAFLAQNDRQEELLDALSPDEQQILRILLAKMMRISQENMA